MDEPAKFTQNFPITRIELGDFTVELRGNKFNLFSKKWPHHFTLIFGEQIIDIHRTWMDERGEKRHETIFAILREQVPVLLTELEAELHPAKIARLLRPLRIGWLSHRKIEIVSGACPTAEEVESRRSGRRLVFKTEDIQKGLRSPDFLEDIWNLPDAAFPLVKRGRIIGYAIKLRHDESEEVLRWIKSVDLMKLMTKVGGELVRAVSSHQIPAEKYSQYDVLRPTAGQL